MRIERQHLEAIGAARSRPFVLGLLLAIATALLCALLPAGLPSTRTLGSAFSPATTVESLNPPTSRIAVKRIAAEDDRGDRQSVAPDRSALAPTRAALAPPSAAAPSPAHPAPAAAFPPGAPLGAAFPRGPPAA